MRVLITGAGGQLGIDLVRCCESAGDDVVAATRSDLDISDRGAVHAAVTTLKPDVVINCAAWTAVDDCEGDPDRALQHNGLAVRWLAESCDRSGAQLVQLSTDYVFDGSLGRPYNEWDDAGASQRLRQRASGSANARRWRWVLRRRWCARRGCAVGTAPTW